MSNGFNTYVYAYATCRDDGMRFAVNTVQMDSPSSAELLALFAHAEDLHRFIDSLRTDSRYAEAQIEIYPSVASRHSKTR